MRTHARSDEGRCTQVVIPAAAGEREGVCVCVCGCEREREARRSDAVRVGPTWFQRHGREFVKGVKLEARGGGHAKAKRGKEQLYSMSGQGQARGNIYATRYVLGSDLNKQGNQERTKWV